MALEGLAARLGARPSARHRGLVAVSDGVALPLGPSSGDTHMRETPLSLPAFLITPGAMGRRYWAVPDALLVPAGEKSTTRNPHKRPGCVGYF